MVYDRIGKYLSLVIIITGTVHYIIIDDVTMTFEGLHNNSGLNNVCIILLGFCPALFLPL